MQTRKSNYVFNELAGLGAFEPGQRTLWFKEPMMQGEDVKFVQRIVGASVDGLFGPQTKAAVEQWQRNNNLKVDGNVGSSDWAVMKKQKTGGVLPSWDKISSTLDFAVEMSDDDPDNDWNWLTGGNKTGDETQKEKGKGKGNGWIWGLALGAVGISLLGVTLAASGEDNNK